eukprot:2413826-Prymnesium_polylepis.1
MAKLGAQVEYTKYVNKGKSEDEQARILGALHQRHAQRRLRSCSTSRGTTLRWHRRSAGSTSCPRRTRRRLHRWSIVARASPLAWSRRLSSRSCRRLYERRVRDV